MGNGLWVVFRELKFKSHLFAIVFESSFLHMLVHVLKRSAPPQCSAGGFWAASVGIFRVDCRGGQY